MRTYFSILLGLTATIVVSACLPVQAKTTIYQEESGKASLKLDPETLNVLNSVGLSLASVESTAVPDQGFTYGWNLIPPSTDPNVRGTNVKFSYDDQTGDFIPLGTGVGGIEAVEEFDTTITFNVDTTKLALAPQLILKGITLTLNPERDILSSQTVANGLPLFDLKAGAPPAVDTVNNILRLNRAKTYVSQELSDLLVAAGASKSTAGLEFADAQTVYNIAEVPEPDGVLPIVMAASAALVLKKWKRQGT